MNRSRGFRRRDDSRSRSTQGMRVLLDQANERMKAVFERAPMVRAQLKVDVHEEA
jgi:hypothetical protein